jgi:hypothetical protein
VTIFTVVVAQQPIPPDFTTALTTKFADDYLWVAPNVCLVAGKGTAQDISNALGISEGTTASGIVSAMGSYYGRAPTNVWEWVKAKWEQTSVNE